MTGSSPRARGTAIAAPSWTAIDRFIPASAGNGAWVFAPVRLRSVHPRERGERLRGVLSDLGSAGSSPRARGTGAVEVALMIDARFIPASAGNGRPAAVEYAPVAVHPRERGEREILSDIVLDVAGSSPRARGTGLDLLVVGDTLRFIPASAGNGDCQYLQQCC